MGDLFWICLSFAFWISPVFSRPEFTCLTVNPCQNGGRCRPTLAGVMCDCSLTEFEGPDCSVREPKVISFDGEHLVQFVGNQDSWTQGSFEDRIALDFKTHSSDGLVLAAGCKGETPIGSGPETLISVAIVDKYLHVFIDATGVSRAMPYQPLVLDEVNTADGQWHSLELRLQSTEIIVKVDEVEKRTQAGPGKQFQICRGNSSFGGLLPADLVGFQFDDKLKHNSHFIGCMRRVYYGPTNVLEQLKSSPGTAATLRNRAGEAKQSSTAIHRECLLSTQKSLFISLLSTASSAVIPQPGTALQIDLKFDFRLQQFELEKSKNSTFLSADLKTLFGAGDFKIFLLPSAVDLEFNYRDSQGAQRQFRTFHPIGGSFFDGEWHSFRLQWPTRLDERFRREVGSPDDRSEDFYIYAIPNGIDSRSTLTIEVDELSVEMYPETGGVRLDGSLTLGRRDHGLGFVGCIRDIRMHNISVDHRLIRATSPKNGLSADSCASQKPEAIQSVSKNHQLDCGFFSTRYGAAMLIGGILLLSAVVALVICIRRPVKKERNTYILLTDVEHESNQRHSLSL